MTNEELSLIGKKFLELSVDDEFAPISEIVRRLVEEVRRLRAALVDLKCVAGSAGLYDLHDKIGLVLDQGARVKP